MRLKNMLAGLPWPRLWTVVQLLLVMAWLTNLAGTDALFSVYALVGIFAVFSILDNYRCRRFTPEGGWAGALLLSALFALAVTGANYPLFTHIRDTATTAYATSIALNLMNTATSLVGGTVLAFACLTCLAARFPLIQRREAPRPGRVFWICFAVLVLIDGIYLFLDEYPGHITQDSYSQILQGCKGVYVNDHPFWHTYLIRVLLSLGYSLFGSANGAAAFFSVCQILLLAGCMSYMVTTLYQLGLPRWTVGLALALYGLMPYHIAYSITMWKDIPFSVGIAMTVTALLRLYTGLSRGIRSYIPLAAGALLLGLMRTSGTAALAGATVLMLPGLWKYARKALPVLIAVLAVCLILTGPVLGALGVVDTDPIEGWSLPLQQVARVVAEGCSLTEEETALLSRVADLEQVKDLYTPWLSDPIKNHVRQVDPEYFTENLPRYRALWLELGCRYPGEYLKAWVEQTKGYWNGGYDYHQYAEMMVENDMGFAKTAGSNPVARLMGLYFALGRHLVFFQPLQSIGLHVWLLVICLYLNLHSKRPGWMLSIPPLVIVAGLLFGTPVFAEFRYVYSLFLTAPLILGVTAFRQE